MCEGGKNERQADRAGDETGRDQTDKPEQEAAKQHSPRRTRTVPRVGKGPGMSGMGVPMGAHWGRGHGAPDADSGWMRQGGRAAGT